MKMGGGLKWFRTVSNVGINNVQYLDSVSVLVFKLNRNQEKHNLDVTETASLYWAFRQLKYISQRSVPDFIILSKIMRHTETCASEISGNPPELDSSRSPLFDMFMGSFTVMHLNFSNIIV